MPESIRFWKTRIETIDPDKTFRVGLIYGPSGCGKSSLVKAGVLPRLGEHILSVYVEATPAETEPRLVRAVRKACPDLSPRKGLVDSLMAIRQGRVLQSGQKVLLVLDQFEQWLHAKRGEENTELVAALRQCDGEHLQSVVMVRDDFWMAATRFMDALEVELLKGHNTAAVDLFDPQHAQKVLGAFGTAYGKLPERARDRTREQQAFVDQATTELAQDGKVISVRLALFAEMVMGKRWAPATLREVGGTEGVGVTFLEETFSSPQANPKHRLHQKAAQKVLKSLLPETGADIKGQMRSEQELQEAAAYSDRPGDFADLMHILDGELRLITPTDPEGVAGDEWRVVGGKSDSAASSPATHHPSPATTDPEGVAGDEWRVTGGKSDSAASSPATHHPSPATTDPEGVAGDEWRVTGGKSDSAASSPATHHPSPATTDPEGVAGDEWRVTGGKSDSAASSPATHHPSPATTDPEGVAGDEWRVTGGKSDSAASSPATHHPSPATRYYQLTHDYLVHSLRDWLTHNQRETRRGRAELRLAERSASWNAKAENRHLPTLWEWLRIRTLTHRRNWTDPQRAMMQRASRFHRSRLTIAAVLMGLLAAAGFYTWNRVDRYQRELLAQKAIDQEATRIEGLVGSLVSAEPNQLPNIVKELDANPKVAATYLSPLLAANAATVDEKRGATACSPRAGFPRPVADRSTVGRTAHQQGRLRRPDSSATASLRG